MSKKYASDFVVLHFREQSGPHKKPKIKKLGVFEDIGTAIGYAMQAQKQTHQRIAIYLNGHEIDYSRIQHYQAIGYEL